MKHCLQYTYLSVISGGTSKERLIGYGGMRNRDRRRVMTDDGGSTKGIELKKRNMGFSQKLEREA